jgi:hypothetical protein
MQAAGGAKTLVERTEHHRENSAECAMKTPDRISKRVRMLFDRGGDPRVSKLQQQRAARAQEYCSFPIDLPGDRSIAKDAGKRASRCRAHPVQLILQAFSVDELDSVTARWHVHVLRLRLSTPASIRG